MYFTASTVAILALAAGSQAAVPKKGEPPVLNHKSVIPHSVSTGSHPIMTGISGGNSTGGGNSTVTVTSSGVCPGCPPGSTVPVHVPTATPSAGGSSGAAGTGAAGAGAAGAGASGAAGSSSGAAPSSSPGFTPSNPGAKVAVPMAGVLGSVAYGLLLV